MPFVYIIYSGKLNKYYVGACIDLDRRLHEHNIGHSKFTATGLTMGVETHRSFSNTCASKK